MSNYLASCLRPENGFFRSETDKGCYFLPGARSFLFSIAIKPRDPLFGKAKGLPNVENYYPWFKYGSDVIGWNRYRR